MCHSKGFTENNCKLQFLKKNIKLPKTISGDGIKNVINLKNLSLQYFRDKQNEVSHDLLVHLERNVSKPDSNSYHCRTFIKGVKNNLLELFEN